MATYRFDASEESRISGNIPQKILALCQERGIDLSDLDYWNRGIIEIPLPADAKALVNLISEWNEVDEGQPEKRERREMHVYDVSFDVRDGAGGFLCRRQAFHLESEVPPTEGEALRSLAQNACLDQWNSRHPYQIAARDLIRMRITPCEGHEDDEVDEEE